MKTYFDGNFIEKFEDGEVRFLHPILWAIKSDQMDLLTLFGRIGVDFNIKDRIGKTPLHYACLHGKQVIFDYLIEHGKINVDALDHYERTALHYACKNGQLAMVQYLVAQTGDIFKRDKSNWNALHWAARFGKEDVVEFLLDITKERQESLNTLDWDLQTPLHLACKSGNIYVVQALLEVTLFDHINLRNTSGHTPFDIATLNGSFAVRRFLLHYSELNFPLEGGLISYVNYVLYERRFPREILVKRMLMIQGLNALNLLVLVSSRTEHDTEFPVWRLMPITIWLSIEVHCFARSLEERPEIPILAIWMKRTFPHVMTAYWFALFTGHFFPHIYSSFFRVFTRILK